MEFQKVKLNNAEYWIDGSGFLCCRFYNDDFDHELGIEDTKSHISTIISLCQGQARPFLIDRRDAVGVVSMEAGKFMAQHNKLKALRLSEAFVVNTLATRLLVNFYTRIYKTQCPSAVFNVMEEALDFCSHHSKSNNHRKQSAVVA